MFDVCNSIHELNLATTTTTKNSQIMHLIDMGKEWMLEKPKQIHFFSFLNYYLVACLPDILERGKNLTEQ